MKTYLYKYKTLTNTVYIPLPAILIKNIHTIIGKSFPLPYNDLLISFKKILYPVKKALILLLNRLP